LPFIQKRIREAEASLKIYVISVAGCRRFLRFTETYSRAACGFDAFSVEASAYHPFFMLVKKLVRII
jgi:hypothetical protein